MKDTRDKSAAPAVARGTEAAIVPQNPSRSGSATEALVTRETYRGPDADTGGPGTGWRRHPITRTDLALAAMLIPLVILVRWPFVQVGETLLNPDEAIVGLMALDVAAGDRLPIYFYGQRYMGSLEAYVIAAMSTLFDDPVRALRFGPSCVFAVCVAVQFLMLARWLGRRGGLVGAGVLLACSPMFCHWSVSARGGYVEILLWGTCLLWAYGEWFVEPVPPADARRRRLRQLLFGGILGSGFWINPSIILFVAPIALHALLHRPLGALAATTRPGAALEAVRGKLGVTTLPVAALAAVSVLNAVSAVWVDQGVVRYSMLFGLGPSPAAYLVLGVAGAAVCFAVLRYTRWVEQGRGLLTSNAAMVLGVIVGAAPAILYILLTTLGGRPLDPSLPMGIRPLWLTGETLVYLMHGLPLLFGADPRPFVHLMGMGHADVTQPLSAGMSGLVSTADWLVVGGLVLAAAGLLVAERRSLSDLFRLRPRIYPPTVLLAMAFAVTVGLFVLGGCTMNFTTIRYLVPIWCFVPGLIAAAFVHRSGSRRGWVMAALLFGGWSLGQAGMHAQLGAPHPLRAVAAALQDRGIDRGIAEPLDAHMLSFMTARQTRLTEFESFWIRLPHHRDLLDPNGPVDYIVETHQIDWTTAWTDMGWPGWPPPQTMRFLWPKLRRELAVDPTLLLSRQRLAPGYELFRLRRPLEERAF